MTEVPAKLDDTVTRYIYSKSLCRSDGTVRHSAFTPPTPYPNEISIDKTSDPEIEDNEIWNLGKNARKDKPIFGRADLSVKDVVTISDEQGDQLSVLIDGIPQPRHGNIKSIPTLVSLRRVVTVELAQKATLRMAED